MHAADMVATKAGGLTVSEALAAGKPLLIHGAPPGQEAGNRRYIEAIGAGCWTPTADVLVAQVRRWLADPAALSRVAAAARQHGRPEAARHVAAVAWKLIAGAPAVLPIRAQAEGAIAGLDGKEVKGRRVTMNEARPRARDLPAYSGRTARSDRWYLRRS